MYSCLTQEQIADFLGISKSKYHRKENGVAKFERHEVIKIAKILKQDENQLLTYWMADNIREFIEQDKELVKNALEIVEKHIDDYDTCIITPTKSDSYSSNIERMMHRCFNSK